MNQASRGWPEMIHKQVVSDLEGLGGLFCFLGLLTILTSFRDESLEALALANSLVLVGPGVWYFLAGRWTRRMELWVLPVTLKVAAGQAALVLGLLVMGALMARRMAEISSMLVIPAMVMMFFIPALAAAMWHVMQLRRVSHLLMADGHAFEPVKVQPLKPDMKMPLNQDARQAGESTHEFDGP